MGRTIAAISTPIAEGGIAVIRISGDDALAVGSKIFKVKSRKCDIKAMEGFTAGYGAFIVDKKEIDDGVCIVYRNPKSYTGEDVVELCCHGGVLIANLILKECIIKGAKLAMPGEFTKRAYLNDKITLTQAEAVNDLIRAKSVGWLKNVASIKNGDFYKKINSIKKDLIYTQASITSQIEYPEEDGGNIDYLDLYNKLNEGYIKLSKMINNEKYTQLLKYGVKTVLVGKPNVGKSTIMNLISDSDKSIVTNFAGTTRDLIEQEISIDGIPFILVDTAGIRDATNEVEKIGIDRAKKAINSAELQLVVIDASDCIDKEDEKILELSRDDRAIVIVNKTDKKKYVDYNKILKDKDVVYTTKDDKQTIENLKAKMIEKVKLNKIETNGDMLLNQRQYDATIKSTQKMKEVLNILKKRETIDIISVLIEEVLKELAELTGEDASETVIESVFKNFCVGK